MLPPADPAVLSANAKFNALYQDLCANKLNADGTSRIQDPKVLKEREGFGDDLRKARVEAARRDLVASGLRELPYDGSELPEDLRELVAVVAAILEGQIAEEDRDLLQDDVAKFKTNIEPIASALSHHFQEDIASLSALLDPDNPPPLEDILASTSDLQTSGTTTEDQLNLCRFDLATQAARVHALNRQIQHAAISILEQNLHGSVARASKSKAEYLATVAEGMSKKLTLQQRQLDSQLYSSEVQQVLRAKGEELESRSKAMRRKVREAEERLEGYRAVGGMEGLAREFAAVKAESERVRGEIERLLESGEEEKK